LQSISYTSWCFSYGLEGGAWMYAVSDEFLTAVQENARTYYWSGTITTTAGKTYTFDYQDIVKGSGYVTSKCCSSSEIELGTVYAAEMGITLYSDVDRYTLEDAVVELFYHLELRDETYETVPMGIFEVAEANRTSTSFGLASGISRSLYLLRVVGTEHHHLHKTHCDADKRDIAFRYIDGFQDLPPAVLTQDSFQRVRIILFLKMAQFRHAMGPKMIAEPSELLLQPPETAFDRKSPAIKLDDLHRGQRKIRAHKDAAESGFSRDHKDKAEFLVQPLAPEQVQ